MNPAPALSPEERERRRQMKNERNRRYYNAHRDDINVKRVESYNPEKKREYYYGNHETVLNSQRENYRKRKESEKKERLNALLQLIPHDEGLKRLIATHLENLNEIKLSEIATLERNLILSVNKQSAP